MRLLLRKNIVIGKNLAKEVGRKKEEVWAQGESWVPA